MFTVVQFFEQQQLRVLAVPVSWVRDGFLMWPKLPSNEKLEKLRSSGADYHGATKKIPVIPSHVSGRRYKNLQTAEAVADDLLKLEVSDIEAKRKLSKQHKAKTANPRPLKDYNKIVEVLSSSKKAFPLTQRQNIDQEDNQKAGPSRLLLSSPHEFASDSASRQSQLLQSSQLELTSGSTLSQVKLLQTSSQKLVSDLATNQTQLVRSSPQKSTSGLASGSTSSQSYYLQPMPQEFVSGSSQMLHPPSQEFASDSSQELLHQRQVLHAKTENFAHHSLQGRVAGAGKMGSNASRALPPHGTQAVFQSLPQNQEQVQYIYETDGNMIYQNPPTDNSSAPGYSVDASTETKATLEFLKTEVANLGNAISTIRNDVNAMKNQMGQMQQGILDAINISVRQVVEDCLEKSVPQIAAVLDMEQKDQNESPQDKDLTEDHKLIDDEEDLINFNRMLSSKEIFGNYVKYFSKMFLPGAYSERGDSACYTIADCLFTRTFWNKFTWTGINRGNKSRRGFREFINVHQLLMSIVSVSDPTYTRAKLELFCKNRLFRYSKARSASKQLRKPTCRVRVKKAKMEDNASSADQAHDYKHGDEQGDDQIDKEYMEEEHIDEEEDEEHNDEEHNYEEHNDEEQIDDHVISTAKDESDYEYLNDATNYDDLTDGR